MRFRLAGVFLPVSMGASAADQWIKLHRQARPAARRGGWPRRRAAILGPGTIAIRSSIAAGVEFTYGRQKDQRIKVEFEAKPDAGLATSGVVRSLEFRDATGSPLTSGRRQARPGGRSEFRWLRGR